MIINLQAKREKINKMKAVVFEAMLKYYKDLASSSGISLPYFVEARNLYNERVKSIKDLSYLYNKIIEVRI